MRKAMKAATFYAAFVGMVDCAWAQSTDLPICDKFDGTAQLYACSCAADAAVGDVFGTSKYSPDTALCAGAVHAGVIKPTGGIVQIIRGVAQDGFVGSEKHGIVSKDAPAADFSIFFMPS